jgi:hypothetical protein
MVRCDSIQNVLVKQDAGLTPQIAQSVDIVPINMSECIYDMQATASCTVNNHVALTDQMVASQNVKKQNRRLQSSNMHNGMMTSVGGSAPNNVGSNPIGTSNP